MTRRIHFTLIPAILALAACAAKPPAARPIPLPERPEIVELPRAPLPVPVEDEGPASIHFAGRDVPTSLAIDGSLAEWGLLEPTPAPPSKDAKPAEPPKPARSHVLFAVSATTVAIAADLHGSMADGIWFGVKGAPTDLPPIGDFQRGGGVRELNCEWDGNAGPRTPKSAAQCKVLLANYATFVASYAGRVQRTFRLDADGVRERVADGSLHPVDGSHAVATHVGDGLGVEATLPVAVLPEIDGAPLTSLFFAAHPASTSSSFVDGEWSRVGFPEGIGFGPHADILERVYETLDRTLFNGRMTYLPSDPTHLLVVDYANGAHELGNRTYPLFTFQKQFGDLEIGYASTPEPAIAILRGGKLVQLTGHIGGPRAILERDGEVHVVGYEQGTSLDDGTEFGEWKVVAIRPDGTVRDDIIDASSGSSSFHDVVELHSADYASFGYSAKTFAQHGEPARKVKRTWSWSPTSKRYEFTSKPMK